jgi:iron complex outermembrane receptor protein
MKNRTLTSRQPRARRRRGTSRLFVLGAAFMASTAIGGRLCTPAHAQALPKSDGIRGPVAAVGAQAAYARRFDIAAGSFGSVTDRFTAVTGIRFVFASSLIRDLPSPGVTGTMTAEQALAQ